MMCEAGNIVHFEADNTYIQNVKSGNKTYRRNIDNCSVVDMCVPVTVDSTTASFIGQGNRKTKNQPRQ